MAPETKKMMDEIVSYARAGHEIYPMMFQPLMGRSNTVSAAIRTAKKLNLIEQHDVDGLGKPIYRAVMPNATHAAPATLN